MKYILRSKVIFNITFLLIFELQLLCIFNYVIKDHPQMVASVDFLKGLILLSSLQFQYLLKILSQLSIIVRLAEDTMSTKMCGFPLL